LKTDFVLVDFENVQPENLALLSGGSYNIKVFLGTHQGKIPLAMARALQAFGPNAEYIQINGNGNNAVDFHIAYYIGRLVATAPDAHFHVISKDTGFDPLLKHLKEQGVSCGRSTSVAGMSLPKASTSESIADRVDAVIENLAKRKSAKPRTAKALRTTINALFAGKLLEDQLDCLIEHLAKRGVISVADGKVHYELPT
jgi:hypothetical protein